jgi:hypothetical protein
VASLIPAHSSHEATAPLIAYRHPKQSCDCGASVFRVSLRRRCLPLHDARQCFFPYGTFITMRTRFETAGFYCDLLQFPLYATLIAALNNWKRRLVGVVVLLVIHSIAAVGAVTMYRWW